MVKPLLPNLFIVPETNFTLFLECCEFKLILLLHCLLQCFFGDSQRLDAIAFNGKLRCWLWTWLVQTDVALCQLGSQKRITSLAFLIRGSIIISKGS